MMNWNEALNSAYEPTEDLGFSEDRLGLVPKNRKSESWNKAFGYQSGGDDWSTLIKDAFPETSEQKSLGLLRLAGRGIAEGLTTEIPSMIGRGIQFITPDAIKEKIGDPGKSLADWADKKAGEWYGDKPENLSFLETAVYEGTKMLAPSIVPAGMIGIGTRVLLGIGNTMKAAKAAEIAGDIVKATALFEDAQKAANIANTAASAGTAAIFGFSQSQQTVDTAEKRAAQLEKEGKIEEAKKMRESAHGIAPLATGFIEAAGEYFGTKYLGKLFGLSENEIIQRGAKNLVKDFLKTLGVEIGTEMGQNYGEAMVEKQTGIRPEADPLSEALDVIGPTVFMTLLTGGLGAGYQKTIGDHEEPADEIIKNIAVKHGTEDPALKDQITDNIRDQKRQIAKDIRDEVLTEEQFPTEPAPLPQNRGMTRFPKGMEPERVSIGEESLEKEVKKRNEAQFQKEWDEGDILKTDEAKEIIKRATKALKTEKSKAGKTGEWDRHNELRDMIQKARLPNVQNRKDALYNLWQEFGSDLTEPAELSAHFIPSEPKETGHAERIRGYEEETKKGPSENAPEVSEKDRGDQFQYTQEAGTKAGYQEEGSGGNAPETIKTESGESFIKQGGKWYSPQGKEVPYSEIEKKLPAKSLLKKSKVKKTPESELSDRAQEILDVANTTRTITASAFELGQQLDEDESFMPHFEAAEKAFRDNYEKLKKQYPTPPEYFEAAQRVQIFREAREMRDALQGREAPAPITQYAKKMMAEKKDGKPLTKKEKSLREYKDYVATLSEEEKTKAGDLIVSKPEFALQQKRRIEKKISRKTVESKPKTDTKPVSSEKILGKNTDGEEVGEDASGNRYHLVNGIIASAPRLLGPGGQAMTPYSPKELFDQYSYSYLTKQEYKRFSKQAKIPEKPLTKQGKPVNIKQQAERPAEEMTAEDLLAEWDRQAEEKIPEPTPEPTARDKVKETADHLKDALSKFAEINKILGSEGQIGEGLDPKKWELIRPLLQDAWDSIVAAGKSGKEFVQLALKNLSPKGRPYFEKFVKEEIGKEGQHGKPTGTETLAKGEAEISPSVRTEAGPERIPEKPGETTTGIAGQSQEGRTAIETATEKGQPGEGPNQRNRPGVRGAVEPGAAETPPGEPGTPDQGLVRESELAPEDRNHVIEDDDVIFPRGPETKIRANIKAIRLLKILQSENRNPTPEEKKILAQYVGWGAFSQKIFKKEFSGFLERRSGEYTPERWFWQDQAAAYNKWAEKYGKRLHPALGGAMTEEEWKSAEESTINAHFTSKPVIQSMWALAEKLGFKGGTILEPGAGVGHFFGLMPRNIAAKSSLFGVELDTISGAILEKLYPQAQIEITGFEKSRRVVDNSIDLTITNVPFADYRIIDKKHPDYSGMSLHNYFIAHALNKAKPGGLVMAITSSWTMDAKSNGKIREYFANKADLVGAIRLPNNAFKENAGTEVTTDILILRKKDSGNVALGNDFRVTHTLETKESKEVVKELAAAREKFAKLNVLTKTESGKKRQRTRIEKLELKQARDNVDKLLVQYTKLYGVNEYFLENPDMVLGKHSMKGTMYAGETYTVESTGSGTLEEHLDKAIKSFPENIAGEGSDLSKLEKVQFADLDAKEGTLTRKDGKIFLVDNSRLVAPYYLDTKGKKRKVSGSQLSRLKNYLEIRDLTASFFDVMAQEETTDEQIEAIQNELNRRYDRFVSKYKHFGHTSNSFLRKIDNDFAVVDALEIETEDGPNDFEKAPIFSKRTIFPFIEPTSANSIDDAASLSIIYRGSIVPAYIAELTGIKNIEDVKSNLVDKGLAFIDPETGLMEARDIYLSGNVKKKLIAAKAASEDNPIYKKNIKALEAVVPEDMDIAFIEFRLGSSWIPSEVIQGFIEEVIDVDSKVEYTSNDVSSVWKITETGNYNNIKNRETYGTKDNYGTLLIENALNMRRVTVKRTVRENGTTRTYEDKDASRENNLKIQEINSEFVTWAKTHGKWAPIIARKYNEEKNGHILRKHTASVFRDAKGRETFHYPNASTAVTLREHQRIAVSRALQESVLLAYGVGTGKTYIYITAAMEMRRIGTARKPLIVAHNQTIDQYRKSFKTLYPGAKVLIPNYQQRSSRMRKKTLVSMATGDWDAIVLPQSFFDGVANDPARETAFVDEMLEMIDQQISDAEADEGKNSLTVKELVKLKKRKRQKLEALLDRRKDEAVIFEQMGIDALLVDEVHAYKRSEFYTKMNRVKGIDSGSSQRSTSLILKSDFVREKTGGKNIITATGTPISNTMAELWTMLRYVRPDLLKEYGVELFDDFASTFGNVVEGIEETASGYKLVERFAEYINGPELLTMFFSGADVRLTKDANLTLPEMQGGKPKVIVSEKSEDLNQYIKDIISQWKAWEKLTGREKMKQRHVPLVLYGKAKKAAIDLRLIDPDYYKEDPKSKLSEATRNIYRIWNETQKDKSTQIVFLDVFRDRAKNPKFNAQQWIKEKLISMGIPKSQVVLFSEAGTSDAAQGLMKDRIRNGDIRVVIGSSGKLGVGVDIADKMIAAHHLNVPDRPMDIEQRDGRIIRQTNENKKVQIYHYCTKDTLDSVMFGRLVKKQKYADQVLTGDIEGRTFKDPYSEEQASFAEFAAASSGEAGKLLFEKNDLLAKENQYKVAQTAHIRKVSNARRKVKEIPDRIEHFERENRKQRKLKNYVEENFEGLKLEKGIFEGETPGGETHIFLDLDRKELIKKITDQIDEISSEWDKKFRDMAFGDYRKLLKEADARVLTEIMKAGAGGIDIELTLYPNVNYDVKEKPSTKIQFNRVYNPETEKWEERVIKNVAISYLKNGENIESWFSDPRTIGHNFTRNFNSMLQNIVEEPARTQSDIAELNKDLDEFKNISKKTFKYQKDLSEVQKRISDINDTLLTLSNESTQDIPPSREIVALAEDEIKNERSALIQHLKRDIAEIFNVEEKSLFPASFEYISVSKIFSYVDHAVLKDSSFTKDIKKLDEILKKLADLKENYLYKEHTLDYTNHIGPRPLYSAAETTEKSDADKVADIVMPYLKGMANFPVVQIVQSVEHLPKDLRSTVETFSKRVNKKAEGFYDKSSDVVYLIADNLSPGRVEAVLRHEAEGHRGIRLLMGKELDPFLDAVAAAKRKDLKRSNPGLNFNDQDAVRVAAEEWLTRKIETGTLPANWWDRLVRAFRKWVRKLVPNLKLTDREIRSVLADTVKNVREGKIDRLARGTGMPLFSFAGEKARTANTSLLAKAQQMIDQGADPEKVLEKTGWTLGFDDKWKFEIDDSDANLKRIELDSQGIADKATRLDTILHHDKLFEAYPELRTSKVEIMIDPNMVFTGGSHRPKFKDLETLITVKARDIDQARRLLLHETQHAIQSIEGFARGANLQFTSYKKYLRSAGEIEARETASRAELDMEQRRFLPPYLAGIPKNDVIVKFQGGIAAAYEPNVDEDDVKKSTNRFIQNAKLNKRAFFNKTNIDLPSNDPKDLIKGFRWIQTMQDMAKNFPSMKQLFDVEKKRVADSNAASVRDRETTENYFTLDKASEERVNKALLDGDKYSEVYSEKQLKEDYGLNPDEIAGYMAVRKALEEKLDEHVARILADVIDTQRTPITDELIQDVKKSKSEEELRDVLMFHFASEYEADKLPWLVNWIKEFKGYVPHKWDADWLVKVNLGEKDEYMFEVPTIGGKLSPTRAGRQKAAKQMAVQVIKDRLKISDDKIRNLAQEGKIVVVRSRDLPVDLFEGARMDVIQSIINDAQDKMWKETVQYMSEDQAKKFEDMQDILKGHIQEMYLAKGWGRHLMGRRGVKGYRTDLKNVISGYLIGANKFTAKGKAAREFAASMKDISPTQTPEQWKHGKQFVSDMLGDSSEAGWFKKIAGTWFLAGDLSAAVLNMTQNWTHAVPMLRSIKPKKDRITSEKEIFRAMKDIAAEYARTRGKDKKIFSEASEHISQEEIDALKKAYAEGHLDPAFLGETTGFHASKIWDNYHKKAWGVIFKLFTGAEGWNRTSTYLAAYRRSIRAGESVENAIAKANEIVEAAHFIYGKGSRPQIVRSTGAIGNIAYTFMTYPLNNLVFLKHRIEDVLTAVHKGDKQAVKDSMKVIGSNLGYVFAFGGLMGLPFSYLAQAILNLFDDDEEDWEVLMRKHMPKTVGRAVTRGLPAALLGNDMSWRVQGTDVVGMPIGFQIAEMGKKRLEIAHKIWEQGDEVAAFFYLMPDMIRNPYRAVMGYREGGTRMGVATRKYTAGEAITKALSFTPTREAEAWKAGEVTRKARELRLDNLANFAERYLRARKDKDRAAVIEMRKDLSEYNRRQKKKDRKGLRISWKDVMESAKSRRRRRGKPYSERAPKYMRRYQRDVEETFGLEQ